jgi:hypothetical protein
MGFHIGNPQASVDADTVTGRGMSGTGTGFPKRVIFLYERCDIQS